MDALSLAGEPYFFMIDFLMEHVEICLLSDINKSGLLIDFQNFKTVNERVEVSKNFTFKSFPMSFEDYRKGFDIVQNHLKKGNSYLVNYTARTEIDTNLSLEEIFYLSKAKYKLCVPGKFVLFSPETFVEIKENRIFTHPMKGTIDASHSDAEKTLRENPKERAEHFTVVDLLRNDLSIVADDVKVDEFQRADFIRTSGKDLIAMSSEISGTLKLEYQGRIGSIMKALLPAGSILGAPKHKTLEIIEEAEKYERGWYTGVCGIFDGRNLDSCVMIRFIEEENGKKFFKSGGGITHLSKAEEEYTELKNKIYVPVY